MTSYRDYDDFIARQTEVVRDFAGADKSDWNRAPVTPTREVKGGTIFGSVSPAGQLSLHDGQVVKPLQAAFANPGKQWTPEQLSAIRSAYKTTFHESSHLLSRAGTDRVEAAKVSGVPGIKGMEEGVTEAYSYHHLDRLIKETELDKVAPGIDKVDGRYSYPQYAPAAEKLAEGIGAQSNLHRDEVLRRLNVVNKAEKWGVATDLVYDSSNLKGLLPEQERDAAKARISDAMRKEFADLPNLKPDRANGVTLDDVRAKSAEAGKAAVASGQAEVATIEREHQERQQQVDRQRGPEQQAGQRPTGPEVGQASAEPEAGQQPDALDEDLERQANEADPNRQYVSDTLPAERDPAEVEREANEADPNRAYVSDGEPRAERDVAEIQEDLERQANEADPNRQYVSDTLPAERDPAEVEREANEADPNRQYASDGEQVDRDPAEADRELTSAEPTRQDEAGTDRQADPAAAPEQQDSQQPEAQQWAPPNATDRLDRESLEDRSQNQADRAQREQAEQDRNDPNRNDPNRNEPDREQREQAEPNRNEPDREQREQAEPNRNESDRAQREQAEQDRNDPNRNDPNRNEPDREQREQAEPNRNESDREQRDQAEQDRSDPNRNQPGQEGQSERDRNQRDRSQQDPAQRGQGQGQAQRDPAQRDQQERQGQQGKQGQKDVTRQPGQGGAQAQAAPGGAPPGGPPGGPPRDPSKGGAARADRPQGPNQQQGQPKKPGKVKEAATKAAKQLSDAPRKAEAVIAAADPTSGGQSEQEKQRRRGQGKEGLRKLRDLASGGQRPASQAARRPKSTPQAQPHGKGAHTAGKFAKANKEKQGAKKGKNRDDR